MKKVNNQKRIEKLIQKYDERKMQWLRENLQRMGKIINKDEETILLTLHEFLKEFGKQYYRKYTREKVIEKWFEIIWYSLQYFQEHEGELVLGGRSAWKKCLDYGIEKVFSKS